MVQYRDSGDLVDALRQLVESLVEERLSTGGGPNGQRRPDSPGVVYVEAPARIDPKEYADERDGTFDYSRFLHEQNPYGAGSVQPIGLIEALGPARRSSVADPFTKPLRDFSPLEVDECPRWTLGKDTYRVTKAIRVPYRYRHPYSDEEVEASILIGFQGPGY